MKKELYGDSSLSARVCGAKRSALILILFPALSVFGGPGPGDLQKSSKIAACPHFERCEAEQEEPQWCWAACAQMLYRYHGQQVSQKDIVRRIAGNKEEQTAGYFEVMRALSATDVNFRKKLGDLFNGKNEVVDLTWLANAGLEKLRPRCELLVAELERHEPCVIGIMDDPNGKVGHACVVYEVEYRDSQNLPGEVLHRILSGTNGSAAGVKSMNLGAALPERNIELIRAKIFDPWKGIGETNWDGKILQGQLQFVLSRAEAETLYDSYGKGMASPPNSTSPVTRPVTTSTSPAHATTAPAAVVRKPEQSAKPASSAKPSQPSAAVQTPPPAKPVAKKTTP